MARFDRWPRIRYRSDVPHAGFKPKEKEKVMWIAQVFTIVAFLVIVFGGLWWTGWFD